MKNLNKKLRKMAEGIFITRETRAQLIAAAEQLELGMKVFNGNAALVDQARRVLVANMSMIDDPTLKQLAQNAIDDIDDWTGPNGYKPGKNSGNEALSLWFGLSRASFATLPRVALNAMPDVWQQRLADLLNELDETFPDAPDIKLIVRGQDAKGRLQAIPPELTNYRHPDRDAIERWKGGAK